MPFVDVNDQIARHRALGPQQRTPGVLESIAQGFGSGFNRGLEQEQASRMQKEAEMRKFALGLQQGAIEKDIGEGRLTVIGPEQAEQELGEGQFKLGGLVFGRGPGKQVAQKETLEEFEAKKKIEAKYRPPSRSGTSEYTTDQLRKEVANLPVTKDAQKIVSSFNQLQQSAQGKTPISDRSMIFQYMKMLDPTSTVREGEQAQVENARGVPATIMNLYNRTLKGTPLDDPQREDIVNTAKGLADTQLRSFEDFTQTQRRVAKQRGLPEQDIFPNFQIQQIQPKGPPGPPPGAVKAQRDRATGAVRYLDAKGNVIGG